MAIIVHRSRNQAQTPADLYRHHPDEGGIVALKQLAINLQAVVIHQMSLAVVCVMANVRLHQKQRYADIHLAHDDHRQWPRNDKFHQPRQMPNDLALDLQSTNASVYVYTLQYI